MVKDDKNVTGNDRFEGFCIDLLKAISQQVGFQYTIDLVPDNMYGVFIPETNSWNGIVQELMERVSKQAIKHKQINNKTYSQRADLAVASMTINYARESVIDFTKPFMNLGIGILFKVIFFIHFFKRIVENPLYVIRIFGLLKFCRKLFFLHIHIWLNLIGAEQSTHKTILLYEPIGHRDLVLCASCLYVSIIRSICDGSIFSI